ncbi:MAG: hypothetical protein LWX83_09660 [Anaerolineae bacterium]|nr:hypothetical protein [Anaerolineae bacterium]
MHNKIQRLYLNSNQHRPARAILALVLVTGVMLFNSLACSYSETANWYATANYKTATPNVTATYENQLTATLMVGKVADQAGKTKVTILLDPMNERDVSGVQAAAYDMDQYIMVESYDPQGRYLPDLEIVAKSSQFRDSQQTITAQQVDAAWNWGFKVFDSLDISQAMGEMAGSLPLGQVHQALSTTWPSNQPIHFILPVLDTYDPNQNVDVYRTPGSNTLLLLPSGTASSGEEAAFKLARPARQTTATPQPPTPPDGSVPNVNPQPVIVEGASQPAAGGSSAPSGNYKPYVALSFPGMPGRSLTDFLTFAQNLTVGDYNNLTAGDLQWAEMKVNELGINGLPKDYVAPKTVTTDLLSRIRSDQQFVNSLYYLNNNQTTEPCTKAEQLNRVIRQEPAAGQLLNGLKQKVKLVTCREVLSPNKYQTAMYISPTPTPTATLMPTRTPVTPSATATATVLPSSTPQPSATNTSGPTNTPTASSTSQPTATLSPTITNTPTITPTPTITNTPTITSSATITPSATPRLTEEFTVPTSIFIPTAWRTQAPTPGNAVTPDISWPSENRYKVALPTTSSSGDYTLYSSQACLYGTADFKLRFYGNVTDLVTLGWEDDNRQNAIYLTGPGSSSSVSADTAYMRFSTIYEGAAYPYSTTPTPPPTADPNIYLGNSANGTFFTGRITWSVSGNNYVGTTRLYLNNSDTAAATITDDVTTPTTKVPASRMRFIIRTASNGTSDSWVEVDYVNITSENCQ